MKTISDKIFYVGVNDTDKTLFEGLWPLPYGISYNSYMIVDEKVALIDTVERAFEYDFIENIRQAAPGRTIDYLIVNHMEPDHSSLISYVLGRYPDLKVVASAKALPMLAGYHSVPEERVIAVADGEILSLGTCTLSFHMVPMVHWPETMVTWVEEENTVFTGDAFGTFGAVEEDMTDTGRTLDKYRNEMVRYYSNVIGKYGKPVQSAIAKMSFFDVHRICSTHGPIWENEVAEVVSLYDWLSRGETERGVCIAYGSMYGNTARAAQALAAELQKAGVPYAIHDLVGCLGLSDAIRDAFRYDTIVVGSPTYNNGIFPPVGAFMDALQSRLVTGRRFYAFGSYTWSGTSVNLLNTWAAGMGFELLGGGLSFPQAYTAEKCDMAAVAKTIIRTSR